MEKYKDYLKNVYNAQRLQNFQLKTFDESTVGHDIKIQAVLVLMRTTIQRFKLALIIPKLFENPRILGKHLLGTKYEECFHTIKQYCEEKRDKELPHMLDESMNRLFDYLMEKSDLLDYLPSWVNDLGKVDKILIKCMENINDIAKINFAKQARLLLDNERGIHELYIANEEAKMNALACDRQLRMKKMKFLWKSAAKTAQIKDLEEQLAFLKYDFNMRVKQEMVIADTNIKQIHLQGGNKQKELEEEANKIRNEFQKVSFTNFEKERDAKNERNKLILQLQSLIAKYDQTLFDKKVEELSLNDTLTQMQQEMAEFMIYYQREESIYEELYVKKNEELRCQHEAEVLEFAMNRAAKVIQREFRKYLQLRKQLEKRNAKSKKAKAATTEKTEAKGKEAKGKKPKKSAKK